MTDRERIAQLRAQLRAQLKAETTLQTAQIALLHEMKAVTDEARAHGQSQLALAQCATFVTRYETRSAPCS